MNWKKIKIELKELIQMACIVVIIFAVLLLLIEWIYGAGYSKGWGQGYHDGQYSFAYAIDAKNNTCDTWPESDCNSPNCQSICWHREFIWEILNKTNST